MNKFVLPLVAVAVIAVGLFAGLTGMFVANGGNGNVDNITTFKDSGNQSVYVDGKPIIRMFSTSWCPHCKWVGPTFDKVVKEYVAAGKIIAYHWELDTKDNLLTDGVEGAVPQSELAIFEKINPNGSIPTFVFGEKYYRIGTGYEKTQDLLAEEKEFRAVIDNLLK